MDPKESQVLLDSKATLVPRVFQGHREPSDPQERRDQPVNQVCQGCPVPTALRVTPGKRAPLERRDIWAPPVLKGQSATQDHEE